MSMRLRFAPSPTGSIHIGGVRTALYDYLGARSSGGTFILRIEDTDQARSTQESLDGIYRSFEWLGIHWDEGPDVGGPHAPYIQSQRLDLYRAEVGRLIQEGKAYYCFCTEERLDTLRKEQTAKKQTTGYDRHCRSLPPLRVQELLAAGTPRVVRFAAPLEGETIFHDELLGDVRRRNTDLPADPVLVKADGFPTYHMAHPVDDHEMEITHVLRGQEWLPSGHLHLQLFRALGYEPPKYYHLPLLLGTDGQKLSKRHGASSVEEFGERGFLPEALINYVARLGWSYDEKTELFSRAELEKLFSLDSLTKSPAIFDYKKLTWINGQHIRRRPLADIEGLVRPVLVAEGLLPASPTAGQLETLRASLPLIHERLSLVTDAGKLLKFAFTETLSYPREELLPKGMDVAKVRGLLERAAAKTEGFESRTDEQNEEIMRSLAEAEGVKLGDLLMPLRVAVTGSRVSPPLFGCMRLVGRDNVAARVAAALNLLKE